MKNNNFKLLFEEFVRNYPRIRELMGLDNLLIGYKEFQYKNKLGENQDIEKELDRTFVGVGKRLFVIAPTGSGKTFTILKVFNKVKNDNNTIYVNVIVTPKRMQNTQNETLYGELFNTKSIVGGTKINIDMVMNSTLSIVYDRINVLPKIKEDLESKYSKNVIFNIVIDEAHDLIMHQFRNQSANPCLDRIRETLEELKDCSNIVWMTGTFSNCYTLNFKEIMFCYQEEEFSVGKIKLFNCPKTMQFDNFVANSDVRI